jgi:cyanophycinase
MNAFAYLLAATVWYSLNAFSGSADTPKAPDAPKGHLVIIGGGDRPQSIMGTFARLAGGASGKVLVFPQASAVAETGGRLKAEIEALGVGSVVVVAVDREAADTDGALAATAGATGVFFAGGDQNRLTAALLGTRLEARLHELYRSGAVIAGTSAGAAVMSRVMITGDERRPLSKDEAWQIIEADNVVTGAGFGFLEDAIVDQHFVRRRRHNRLISLVLERPALLGIAIDEATAVWVTPDRRFEVIGEGAVLIFDAKGATTAHDAAGKGLRGAGLAFHVLRPGSIYDTAERRVVKLAP